MRLPLQCLSYPCTHIQIVSRAWERITIGLTTYPAIIIFLSSWVERASAFCQTEKYLQLQRVSPLRRFILSTQESK